MNDIPNLRHLIAFTSVVENHSISKASEKIYLSQPAITQALSKIEKNIKTALFERKTDGMSLTKEGDIFYFRVKRAIELINAGIKKTGQVDKNSRNTTPKIFAITTTQLKALIAVSESKNYSAAGRNIGVSQSSLYRACKDLESYLNVILFEKTSIGVSPTKAAQGLAQAVKLAFYEIHQGLSEIDSLNNIRSGNITVGSLPLARSCILPQVINEITQEHKDFNVSVIDGIYEDLLNHLRYGELDVIIGALRFPSPSYDVHQETLFFSANVILARAQHPLFNKEQITINDLAKYGWVTSRENSPGRILFEKLFRDHNHNLPKQLIEASSQILVKELLVGSDKLTMLPEHQVNLELKSGLFKVIPFDNEQQKRAIGLTIRKSWQGTSIQEQFLTRIREVGLSLN
ncbi:MAG: LysR family transcriptional regulator [Vibrio sp.]